MKPETKKQMQGQESGIAAALIAGAAIAEVIKNPHPNGRSAVLVPPGYDLKYLDQPDLPTRKTGTVKLSDVASFLLYFSQQSGTDSNIYGSMQPAQFVAVLNDHGTDQDWRDHRAIYTLTHGKEWTEWTKRDKQPFDGNEAFAIWLENNLVDVVKPEPARLLEIALNMRVNQAQGFSNAVRLDNGEIKFEYSNTVEGGSRVANKAVQLPESFTIDVPVFDGIDAPKYKVEARFRYRLANGALVLRYELIRPHKVVEQAFKDILSRIEKGADRKVLFGTPE